MLRIFMRLVPAALSGDNVAITARGLSRQKPNDVILTPSMLHLSHFTAHRSHLLSLLLETDDDDDHDDVPIHTVADKVHLPIL